MTGPGDRRGRPHTHCRGLRRATSGTGLPTSPAVAVGSVLGDNVCVNDDNISEPLLPPSDDLLDLLRHLAARDDVSDAVRADARDYLEYLEAASSGSGSLTGEARLNMAASAALQHGREVVGRLPRPRWGSRP
jgi:hypothetical protein